MSISEKKKEYREIAEKNKKKDYESWLNSEGGYVASDFEDAVADVKAQKQRAVLSYGTVGRDLSKSGLDNSGYADYLKSSQSAEYDRLYSKATNAKYLGEYADRSGYEKYVADYDKTQLKLRDDVTSEIYEKRIFDLDTAYAIAMDAGLSEENALDLIGTATAEAKSKTCNHVISYARSRKMSASQARSYAKSLGLDEKSITYILEKLEITESDADYYSSLTADQYLEYLQNKYGK